MASLLSEDRVCRKQGEFDAYEDYEVPDGTTVHTNSLVGVRNDNGKVEPVTPSNLDGNPGYAIIGFTEDHLEGDAEEREIRVKFGLSVELDLNDGVSVGQGDIGASLQAVSDHEVDTASSGDPDGDTTTETLPTVGVLRNVMGAASDRAMVDLLDIPEQA